MMQLDVSWYDLHDLHTTYRVLLPGSGWKRSGIDSPGALAAVTALQPALGGPGRSPGALGEGAGVAACDVLGLG